MTATEHDLILSPEQYSAMWDKWAELSYMRPDGSVSNAPFIEWAMREYNLLPFNSYRIAAGEAGDDREG